MNDNQQNSKFFNIVVALGTILANLLVPLVFFLIQYFDEQSKHNEEIEVCKMK